MTQSHVDTDTVTAVILAGGQSRRMGGEDKGLKIVACKPLVEHVIERLSPQLDNILISANRNIDVYRKFGYEVISDEIGDNWGPLAGIYSAMLHTTSSHLLSVPCDTPLLPDDLVSRMTQEISAAEVCIASDGERLQSVIALLSTGLKDQLRESLMAGDRKVEAWMLSRQHAIAKYSDTTAFLNANSPEDIMNIEETLLGKR